MGANIYLRSDLHEKLIRRGYNPADYVNKAVEETLKRDESKDVTNHL